MKHTSPELFDPDRLHLIAVGQKIARAKAWRAARSVKLVTVTGRESRDEMAGKHGWCSGCLQSVDVRTGFCTYCNKVSR